MSDLKGIPDEKAGQESHITGPRQGIDKKDAWTRQFERELGEVRDLSRMAGRFAQAMPQKAGALYRDGNGRSLNRPADK